MYRPTVRMDDVFKDWIEEVVKETKLDRNQIIRLALFSAPYSETFKEQINKRREGDVRVSPALWNKDSDGDLWRCSTWGKQTRGDDVSEFNGARKGISEKFSPKVERPTESDVTKNQRREREVRQPKIFKPGATKKGGIKINFG